MSLSSMLSGTEAVANQVVGHVSSSLNTSLAMTAPAMDQVLRRHTPPATTVSTAPPPKRASGKRKRKTPEPASQARHPMGSNAGGAPSTPPVKTPSSKRQRTGRRKPSSTAQNPPQASLGAPEVAQTRLPVSPGAMAAANSKQRRTPSGQTGRSPFQQPGSTPSYQSAFSSEGPQQPRRIPNPNYAPPVPVSQQGPPELAPGTVFANSVPGSNGPRSLDVVSSQPLAPVHYQFPSSPKQHSGFVGRPQTLGQQSVGPVQASIEEGSSVNPAASATRKIAQPGKKQTSGRARSPRQDKDNPALTYYQGQLGVMERQNKQRLIAARREEDKLRREGKLPGQAAPYLPVHASVPPTPHYLVSPPNPPLLSHPGMAPRHAMSPHTAYAVPVQPGFERERTQTLYSQTTRPASTVSGNRTLSLHSLPGNQSFAMPSQATGEFTPRYPLHASPSPLQATSAIQQDPQFQYVAGVIKNAFAPPGVGPNVKPTPKNAQTEALRYILNRNRSSPEVDEISGLFQREAANSVAPHYSQAVASQFSREALDLKKGEFYRVNYGATP